MSHLALTVYGYSGGVVASGTASFIVTVVGRFEYSICIFLKHRPVVTPVTASFSRHSRPDLRMALIALTATAGGCTSPF